MALFGPSKRELKDRIDTLEDTVDDLAERLEEQENTSDPHQIVQDIHDDNVDVARKYNLLPRHFQSQVRTFQQPRLAWKACDNYIALLIIPANQRVVYPDDTAWPRKLRCEGAYVGKLYKGQCIPHIGRNLEEADHDAVGRSMHDPEFTYEIGDYVQPRNGLDENTARNCTDGIHVFAGKDEAIEWY
jgi:hypothetical protein